MSFTVMDSPVGEILLEGQGTTLRAVHFLAGPHPVAVPPGTKKNDPELKEAIEQLRRYFAGDLQHFSLNLEPEGTPFQRQVWKALRTIPYGATVSYSSLAKKIGKPSASRAVGAANGKNPLSIVVPCHRVIGQNGELTGYASGLPIKKFLLELETRHTGAKLD